jgi:threonine dehydratase
MTEKLLERSLPAAEFGADPYAEVKHAVHELIDFGALEALANVPPRSLLPEDVAGAIKLSGFYGANAVQMTSLREEFTGWDDVRTFTKRETYAHGRWIMKNHRDTTCIATYSAGNHGLGVARFGRWWKEELIRTGQVRLDEDGMVCEKDRHKLLQIHIFVKNGASPEKIAPLRESVPYGTVLHIGGKSLEEAAAASAAFVASQNEQAQKVVAQTLPPYSEAMVMAGQGTVAVEAWMQLMAGGVDVRKTPLVLDVAGGGFGLAIGAAAVLDALIQRGLVHGGSRVQAWQMENCDSMRRALWYIDRGLSAWPDLFVNTNGQNAFDPSPDGTAVYSPNPYNVARVHYLRERGLLQVGAVSKRTLAAWMLHRRERGELLEPAGALPGAARDAWLQRRKVHWYADPTGKEAARDAAVMVVVASGRNVSDETLAEFDAELVGNGPVLAVLGGAATRSVAYNRRLEVAPLGWGPKRHTPPGRHGVKIF